MDGINLEGKTALVTGASSGLGEQFARALSRSGATVIVAARRIEKLKLLCQEIAKHGGKATAIEMDVADRTSVKRALESVLAAGHMIDILVNNAGIYEETSTFSENIEKLHDDFEALMQTNVMGVWYVTHGVVNHMRTHNIAGSIINIGSIYGANRVGGDSAGYCASKAAVIHLTKVLVGELSPHNIRINCISPGFVQTPMLPGWDDKEMGILSHEIPLNFLATPQDFEGALLFLASNEMSRYVTGSCITVDGGSSWGGRIK